MSTTEDIVHQAVDSFLCTLYGQQNYHRWKELKARLCCSDERDFVEWMLDATECFYSNRITSRTNCSVALPCKVNDSGSHNLDGDAFKDDNEGDHDDDDIKLEIHDEFYGERENNGSVGGLLEIDECVEEDNDDEGSDGSDIGMVIPSCTIAATTDGCAGPPSDSLNTPPSSTATVNVDPGESGGKQATGLGVPVEGSAPTAARSSTPSATCGTTSPSCTFTSRRTSASSATRTSAPSRTSRPT